MYMITVETLFIDRKDPLARRLLKLSSFLNKDFKIELFEFKNNGNYLKIYVLVSFACLNENLIQYFFWSWQHCLSNPREPGLT